MIDNEQIEERLIKQKRRRKILVIIELLILALLCAGIIYYMMVVRPAIEAGHPEQAVPGFLRDYITLPESNAAQDPEPTRLPTPTPKPTATPTATPTPTPEPTLAPEIEALRLPSFDKADPSDWNLILVNQDNKIPDDYDFSLVYVDDSQIHGVDERIAEPLLQMLQDCAAAGYSPEICSAYRDGDTQTYLYEEEMDEEYSDEEPDMLYEDADSEIYAEEGPYEDSTDDMTEDEVSTAVAEPGASEHEIGLAVDIFSPENTTLDESQEDTETQQWLMEHCYEYGFILRYPRDKEAITGIIYEPWHYRYVGIEPARDIRDNGLCLEEYLEQMQTLKDEEAALQRPLPFSALSTILTSSRS